MARGDGRVYLRGKVWWIAYSGIDGGRAREMRERGGTRPDAEKLLARRILEVQAQRHGKERFLGPQAARMTVKALVEAYLEDAEMRRVKSLQGLESHAKQILRTLGRYRAAMLTSDDVRRHVKARRALHRADSTIDRELEILRAAYKLAIRSGKLGFAPHIPTVSRARANVRTGFVAPADFYRLLEHVPEPDFVDFLEWFWWTAQRPKEIASLRWSNLDETTGTLLIPAADAKIARSRAVPIVGPLAEIIRRRRAVRRVGLDLVFHAGGRPCGKQGKAGVLDRWYDRWHEALAAAGLPEGLLIYDLRRSAIRNLRKAGVPEKTAMEISGHLTRSTFDRYNIVTSEDMEEALQATEGYVRAMREHGQVAHLSSGRPHGKRV